MQWILRLLGFVILLIAAAILIGLTLPAQTEHTRTIILQQKPETVFAVLTDVKKLPEWNRNMRKIEVLPPIDGKQATKQTFKGGMTMVVVTAQSSSPNLLVREIREGSGPFGGSWTYEIWSKTGGTEVALKERSEINNPFFRVMVKIFGPTKYMDEHLIDLGKRLGETASPR
jgi:hypothetical protein